MNLFFSLLEDMLLAAVPAVGFGMLFNVPRRILPYCAGAGAVAHGLRFLLTGGGLPLEWATLASAGLVSFCAVFFAQRLRAHPKVFTVAAMIPMVPGVKAYTAMLAMVQIEQHGYTDELFRTALQNALSTFFIVGALAVGLALPGLLLYRRRPVV